jgi:hypothetical protein
VTAKGRPSEIDGKLVCRMRDLNKMPWEAIAATLEVSRSGVIAAYRRFRSNVRVTPGDKITTLREALLMVREKNSDINGQRFCSKSICEECDLCLTCENALSMSE